MPVRLLINGATIAQHPRRVVTYWHVELPVHDLVLAEGMPSESYLDTGNRSDFANGGPMVAMRPEFASAVWSERACLPQLRQGRGWRPRRRWCGGRSALGISTPRRWGRLRRVDWTTARVAQ